MLSELRTEPTLKKLALRAVIISVLSVGVAGCELFGANQTFKRQIFTFNGETYLLEATVDNKAETESISLFKLKGTGDQQNRSFVTFTQMPFGVTDLETVKLTTLNQNQRAIAEVLQKGKQIGETDYVTVKPGGSILNKDDKFDSGD